MQASVCRWPKKQMRHPNEKAVTADKRDRNDWCHEHRKHYKDTSLVLFGCGMCVVCHALLPVVEIRVANEIKMSLDLSQGSMRFYALSMNALNAFFSTVTISPSIRTPNSSSLRKFRDRVSGLIPINDAIVFLL